MRLSSVTFFSPMYTHFRTRFIVGGSKGFPYLEAHFFRLYYMFQRNIFLRRSWSDVGCFCT
jgi:hypothetical protein